uniref:Uncharacterized protein n=1 Tax=Arundo donax TaxID=35708 RepID=A0A0A8YPQ5_ARUDO
MQIPQFCFYFADNLLTCNQFLMLLYNYTIG